MRVNDPRPGELWLEQLLWAGDPPRRTELTRALRHRSTAARLAQRCGRLTVGFAIRHGGAVPERVFDDDGQLLCDAPLWSPAVRAASDWRLSASSAELLLHLLETARGEPAPTGLAAQPRTPADLLFRQALAEALERHAGGEPKLVAAAFAASPLADLVRYELQEVSDDHLAALDPWLSAGWLIPYQTAWLARRWLAIDARRRMLSRAEEAALNQRQAAVAERLLGAWRNGRVEGLVVFARYYARWLRLRGGVRGVLTGIRSGPREGLGVAEREAWEDAHGRLLQPVLEVGRLVDELRSLGWQRTPAEEHLIGTWSREVEPVGEALRGLYDELCRVA